MACIEEAPPFSGRTKGTAPSENVALGMAAFSASAPLEENSSASAPSCTAVQVTLIHSNSRVALASHVPKLLTVAFCVSAVFAW